MDLSECNLRTASVDQEVGPDDVGSATLWCVPGTFYHGDNLDVLREWIPNECVDLVYLDPPFNSQRDHNLPFDKQGTRPAQERAFKDTWTWDDTAIRAYNELTKSRIADLPPKLPPLVAALYAFLYPERRDLMAYIAMMAIRLVELRRVMKPTASIYLHCDPSAGHYLKIILDAIFDHDNFTDEVVWQRSAAKGNVRRKFGWVHETLFYYGKGCGSLIVGAEIDRDNGIGTDP
jgi:site-specific DNA-methyltransferase (adenine-specific)